MTTFRTTPPLDATAFLTTEPLPVLRAPGPPRRYAPVRLPVPPRPAPAPVLVAPPVRDKRRRAAGLATTPARATGGIVKAANLVTVTAGILVVAALGFVAALVVIPGAIPAGVVRSIAEPIAIPLAITALMVAVVYASGRSS